MSNQFKLLLRAASVAVLAGVAAAWGLRALDGERHVFYGVARGFNNGPLFGTGDGSRARPWSLRVEAPVTAIDHGKAPVVVSLNDDPIRLFQTRSPSPLDIAAVLEFLRNAGGGNAAIAAVFQWSEANAVAYQGLEDKMDKFGMTIQAAPLKRGTVVEEMPEPFRRAALLPDDAIIGDPGELPMINGLAVKDVFFGGKSLAGFSTLDDVTLADRVPLLARWQDDGKRRVVLAFPLLAVLARHDLPVAGIRVRLGETLELGPKGPKIPIDANGCLLLPPKPVPARVDVTVAELVMANPGIFPRDAGLIVLRDDQSASDEATKRFSARLASVMTAIESDGGLAAPQVYPRLPWQWEAGMAAVLLLAGLLAARMNPFGRNVVMGCLVAAVVVGQWLGFGMAGVWLPGVGLVSGLLVFWWLSARIPARDPEAPAVPVDFLAELRQAPPLRTVTIWREPSHAPQPLAAADAGYTWPPATVESVVQPEVPTEYLFRPRHDPQAEPVAWAASEPEPQPEPAPVPQPEKKKAPARKTAARKTAARGKNKSAPPEAPTAEDAAGPGQTLAPD